MPGFLGSYNVNGIVNNSDLHDNIICKSIHFEDLQVYVRTINKFGDDKLCYEDAELIIIIEGVILNKLELYIQNKENTLALLAKRLYCEDGDTFFNCFRGSFSGLLFDKKKKQLIIFTDHIGDKAIFYSQIENQLYFGSELKYVTELFKENKIGYSLDLAGAYSALTYGYMISDLTYIKDVKRLRGGTYLCIESNGTLNVKVYHQFKYKPNYQLSDRKIIETLNPLFSNAVKLQVDKNIEYGYEDYAALSAGLDSRMTTFAISRLKKSDFTSFTYSPVGFYDQKTSADIVKYLRNNYLFQSHYSGNLLLDIDGSVNENEGLFMYYGSAVLKDFYDKLDTTKIGIIHSGQLGDVFVGGSYNKKNAQQNCDLKNADMHSKHLGNKFYLHFDFDKFAESYPDKEIFSTYNRGYMGINSGANLVFQQFTETLSPFCDVDFCEFCLTIPIEKRLNNYIYDKWILSKYPEAAKFKHNGIRVIGGKLNGITELIARILRKVKKKIGLWDANAIQTVTPLNVWSNNEVVKTGLDNYFNQNISLLDNYHTLQNDCVQLYRTGTALEKNQVLTLLGSVKLFFA